MTDGPDPKSDSQQAANGEPPGGASSAPSPEAESVPHWLARASQCLAASLDYENTLVTVAGMALPYLGSWCIVDVLEADGSMRRLGIIHPDPLKEERARRLKEGWPPGRDDPIGLPGVIRSRATELIPAVSDEMLVDLAISEENLRDLRALGIGSVVVVPLIARDNVLGAITFVSADVGHQYTQTDVELAEDLAARCSIALDNARLFRDLEAARKGAAQLNEQLILSGIRQQELAEEARDANHAKSRFLATMSHEIRTPLTSIVGYTDLLKMGVAGPMTSEQKKYLARVKASSDHLIGLIDDILDLSKVESDRMILDREAIAAQESVSAAIVLIEPQARSAGVGLETECPDASNFYLGDPDRVRQILVILLSNALNRPRREHHRELWHQPDAGRGSGPRRERHVDLHPGGGYRDRHLPDRGGDGLPAVRAGRFREYPQAGWRRPRALHRSRAGPPHGRGPDAAERRWRGIVLHAVAPERGPTRRSRRVKTLISPAPASASRLQVLAEEIRRPERRSMEAAVLRIRGGGAERG